MLLTKETETTFLSELFNDHIRGLSAITNPNTGLVYDISDDHGRHKPCTTPTNIALTLTSLVAAQELDTIPQNEADESIGKILSSLEKIPRVKGFYPNWIDPRDLSLAAGFTPELSCIDNAWLSYALTTTGAMLPDFRERTKHIVNNMNFDLFYDEDLDQLHGVYNLQQEKCAPWTYGLLFTETRLAYYIAIARGDIPASSYLHLSRVMPDDAKQRNPRKGILPSWNGTALEAASVNALAVPESEWSEAYRVNIQRHLKEQMRASPDLWGMSSCENPDGKYHEYSVRSLGTYAGNLEYAADQDSGPRVITPHASILFLPEDPPSVIANIGNLIDAGMLGPYGFYESIDTKSGKRSDHILALSHGMILTAIGDYLLHGKIRERFSTSLKQSIYPLLQNETVL